MGAGRPVHAPQSLSLSGDSGIVDYVPDDLTITVRAGTTVEEIAAATRANNQWLPLDPAAAAEATIGATIATASSGPLAHSFGFARDFVLGLEMVTGKGDIVKTGGRVVKNVAGFDLMRLNCGAWGTLGAITQASLRLYGIPQMDRTFALTVPPGINATRSFLDALRNAPLAALAMEGIHGTLAAALGLPDAHTVLARLAGNPKLVDAQLAILGAVGVTTEVDTDVWTRLRDVGREPADASVRISGLPSDIASLWESGRALLESSECGYLQSTFSRGIVRVTLRGLIDGARIPATSTSQRMSYEVLPREVWATVSPSVTSDPLSRSVKRAFDPHNLLNPGILG